MEKDRHTEDLKRIAGKLSWEIDEMEFNDWEMNDVSWSREEGILISGNTAKALVKACNNHYALIEALKEVVRISDRKHDAWDKAKEAIKQCEG
jgi:hypothetical protein